MKTYTDKEIIDKCQSIWDAEHKKNYMIGWEKDGCINVTRNAPNEVRIKLSCMYEAPVINSTVLFELCDFFDTKNINEEDGFSSGGCKTCDYGSEYGFTLVVKQT